MTNPFVPLKFRKVTRSSVIIKKHAILGTQSVVYPSVVIEEGAASSAMTLFTKSVMAGSFTEGCLPRQSVQEKKKLYFPMKND